MRLFWRQLRSQPTLEAWKGQSSPDLPCPTNKPCQTHLPSKVPTLGKRNNQAPDYNVSSGTTSCHLFCNSLRLNCFAPNTVLVLLELDMHLPQAPLGRSLRAIEIISSYFV